MAFYKEKDSEIFTTCPSLPKSPKEDRCLDPLKAFLGGVNVGPNTDPHKVFERLALFSLKLYLWPFFGGWKTPGSFFAASGLPILWHGVFLETNLQQKTNAEDSAISSQEILLEVVDIRHIQQQPSIGLLCCKSFGCFLGSLGFQTPKPTWAMKKNQVV